MKVFLLLQLCGQGKFGRETDLVKRWLSLPECWFTGAITVSKLCQNQGTKWSNLFIFDTTPHTLANHRTILRVNCQILHKTSCDCARLRNGHHHRARNKKRPSSLFTGTYRPLLCILLAQTVMCIPWVDSVLEVGTTNFVSMLRSCFHQIIESDVDYCR